MEEVRRYLRLMIDQIRLTSPDAKVVVHFFKLAEYCFTYDVEVNFRYENQEGFQLQVVLPFSVFKSDISREGIEKIIKELNG